MKHQPNFFSSDLEIPDIVQQKADEAFAFIQKKENIRPKKAVLFKSQAAVFVFICVLTTSGITAFAAIHHFWSRGMQGAILATPKQQQTLTTQGIAEVLRETPDYADLSVTDNNITITPETVIVDDHFAHISFSVKGFDLDENAEPIFDTISAYLGSVPGAEDSWINSNSSFYSGIVSDENGILIYDDGKPLQFNENGSIISRYSDEDGNLEYILSVSATDSQKSLLGETLHVEMADLCTIHNAVSNIAANGNWSFDIDLPSVSDSILIPVHRPVEGTLFTVDTISISPISIDICYSVNGEVPIFEDENGIPLFSGVILKDGTRLPYLGDMGNSGYLDETMSSARSQRAFTRVIDPTQVTALLFITSPGSDMIEVPIN